MFPIIGILIVIGAIIGGYLMEHGHLLVLFQPAELVVIGGSAFGTIFIANPLPVIKAIFKDVFSIFKSNPYTSTFYLQNCIMLNEVFQHARKNGLLQLESDVEDPSKSPLFSKYKWFVADRHTTAFVCDTLRMCITGGVSPHDVDQMMEIDIEVQQHERVTPVQALTTVADALPGLGIVAAVLGIIVTMGALGGPPEEIGHKVAAALVGTFLGVLLCYGFLGPMVTNLSKRAEAHTQYLYFLRVALISFIKGTAPMVAIEYARRAIPAEVRPSFSQMEKACKGGSGTQAAAA